MGKISALKKKEVMAYFIINPLDLFDFIKATVNNHIFQIA